MCMLRNKSQNSEIILLYGILIQLMDQLTQNNKLIN